MKLTIKLLLCFVSFVALHALVAIALTPCDLLQMKQQELSDVKRSIEESSIMMRAFDEMGKSSEFSYKEQDMNEQTVNFAANLKEFKRLDKTLQMQVDSLTVLCRKEPGLSQSTNAQAIKTASTSSSNIKVVESSMKGQASSEQVVIPTVVSNEGQQESEEEGDLSNQVSERQLDIGLRVVDGAYTVGEGLPTCRSYNTTVPGVKSGKYWLRFKGERYIAYCDMTTLNGGWTLVSSRSSKYEPVNTNNTVMPLSFKGESLTNLRWQGLMELASTMMVTNGKGKYAVMLFGSLAKVVPCSRLTTDLSKRVIFHKENSGCNLVGADYCLIGTNFPGGSTEIANMCSEKIFTKFDFKSNEVNKELDIYVR